MRPLTIAASILLASALGVTPINAQTRAAPLSPEAELALKPADTFKECDNCPEMVVIPAGSFVMGSPAAEARRVGDEMPLHPVTLARPFAVGKFSVRFDEWDACVADNGCNGYRPSDEGWGRDRRPVVNVSWGDAKAYLAWISRKTGKTYRLLSDGEREYVTRAGTTTPFWFGASISTSQANYNGNYTYGTGSKGEYRQKTVPVDSFAPNSFGLYQVHGNVWEWVEDCDHGGYRDAPTDGSAWTSGQCTRRVMRGGFWGGAPWLLRAAARGGSYAGYRNSGWGFRVARTLDVDGAPVQPIQVPSAAGIISPISQAREHALKPQDSFKECDACPEMLVVPAGSFTIGSPASEPHHYEDEDPQHQVTIARPFAVGRFAVTFDEWDACAADTSADGLCYGFKPSDEGWGRGRQPAINLSWTHAKAYVTWLSRKTGKTYRLLTEAEREYVARAGTTTPFWFGTSLSASQANYNGQSRGGLGASGEDRGKTVPVDSFAPNPWGFYQVHGNISEWVEDCYHGSYRGAPSDGAAWTAGDCKYRVQRGGSWNSAAEVLRAAHRGGRPPDFGSSTWGLRVARTLDP
jgi:formylglycine-generating enzyme required for sulfatase activity